MATEATTATAATATAAGDGEMKALLLSEAGSLDNFKVGTFAKPVPGPRDVLIKIKAAALNPVDFKMALYDFLIESKPAVLGCDVSGVVEAVGAEVTDHKVGDEVTGINKLGRTGCGTFAEYCVMDTDLAHPKPKNLSFAQSAGLMCPLLTACIGCFNEELLGLEGSPVKPVEGEPLFLVWGGSGSVGIMLVQLLSQSGYKVVATASPHNFDAVKKAGAAHVVNYRADDAVEQLQAIVGDNLKLAFDTISTATADICASLLTSSAEAPARLAFIAGAPAKAGETVKVSNVFLGEVPASDTRRPWLRDFFRTVVTPLFEAEKLAPHVIEEVAGLEGIVDGLKALHGGKVSAKKLVATIA